MNYNDPFRLSSFVPADAAPSDRGQSRHEPLAARTRAVPAENALTRSRYGVYEGGNEEGSSDDSNSQVEVFYDHQSDLTAWARPSAAVVHDDNQSNEIPSRGSAAPVVCSSSSSGNHHRLHHHHHGSTHTGALQNHSKPTAQQAAMGEGSGTETIHAQQTPVPPPDKSPSRAQLRRYAGMANIAVATMDHAVSIPAALRGAARRTMFDVLVDVEKHKAVQDKAAVEKEKAPETRGGGGGNARGGSGRETGALCTVAAAPSARERTYQALFPSAMQSLQKPHERPDRVAPSTSTMAARPSPGASSADPLTIHSSASSVTLATTLGESRLPHSSRLGEPTSHQSSAVRQERGIATGSSSNDKAKPLDTAGVGPASSKPDRRLRHLIPRHLRGPEEDPVDEFNRADDKARGGAHGGTGREFRDDMVSDISSVSSCADSEADDNNGFLRGSLETAQRSKPTPRPRAPAEKDDCLSRVLEDTRRNSSSVTKPSIDAVAVVGQEGRAGADGSAKGTHWMQQLEERESYNGPGQRVHRHNGVEGSTAVDHGLLEAIVLGSTAPLRPATTPTTTAAAEAKAAAQSREGGRHRRHRVGSQGSAVGASSDATNTADETSATSRSRHPSLTPSNGGSSSSRETSRSNSSAAVADAAADLLRDIDGDVPLWVQQQQQHVAWRQLELHSRHHQHDRVAASTGAETLADGLAECDRLEQLQAFVGKPEVFYPSCAVTHRRRGNADPTAAWSAQLFSANEEDSSALQRANAAPFSRLLSTAAHAAASFMSTWKEGKRLLRHNATALAVVEYLRSRYQRWVPRGERLGKEEEENENEEEEQGGVSARNVQTEAVTAHHSEHKAVDEAKEQESVVPHTSGAPSRSIDGVDLKLSVHYVEAAFNVALVHGVVVWCSAAARERLCDADTCTSKHACKEPLETSWTFLFPEPALMRLRVMVGEHIYLAAPFSVYPATRLVVAAYNFTSDSVIRQQRRQLELELQERRRAVAQHQQASYEAAMTASAATRQRGVSPVRPSASLSPPPPPSLASQGGRSPTEFGRPSATSNTAAGAAGAAVGDVDGADRTRLALDVPPGRSPNRMVYEIPGSRSTPVRSAAPLVGADMNTPERQRARVAVTDDGASPAPLPPVSHPRPALFPREDDDKTRGTAWQPYGLIKQEKPPRHWRKMERAEQHDGNDRDADDNEEEEGESPLPSYVRASVTSVNSFATDGFYDPLAMPALPTTNNDVTIVLTGASASADAAGQTHLERRVTAAKGSPVPAHGEWRADSLDGDREGLWHGEENIMEGTAHQLCIPPPLAGLGSTPGDAVRTFGTAEAAVDDDTVGHGFPRGPPEDWDVPVEVLLALSSHGVGGGIGASTALHAPPSNASPATEMDDARETHYQGDRAPMTDSAAEAAVSSSSAAQHRKRVRERSCSTGSARSNPSLSPGGSAHSGPIATSPTAEAEQRLLLDVSCSFPTPQASSASLACLEVAGVAAAAIQEEASLSSSISSPSDNSDEDTANTSGLRASLAAAARVSSTRRGGGGGSSRATARQLEQQRRQDAWMRALWSQPDASSAAAVEPFSQALSNSTPRRERNEEKAPFVTCAFAVPVEEQSCGVDVGTTPSQRATRAVAAVAPTASVPNVFVHPHAAPEDGTTVTTSAGFFAFDDVVLSDTDE